MSKHQQTGMRGVYLVAAELAARNLVVSPTSRSAAGADLLVTDANCGNAYSVQVKTNAKSASFWLVGMKAQSIRSKSHFYVFVNILRPVGAYAFFVVPSIYVSRNVRVEERPNSTWNAFDRKLAERYRAKWSLLGAEKE